MCTVIAILLHFFYLCTFSWLFLEGLHVYRMLSEVRDVNYGPMRFYYLIGWGVPAFITGLHTNDFRFFLLSHTHIHAYKHFLNPWLTLTIMSLVVCFSRVGGGSGPRRLWEP